MISFMSIQQILIGAPAASWRRLRCNGNFRSDATSENTRVQRSVVDFASRIVCPLLKGYTSSTVAFIRYVLDVVASAHHGAPAAMNAALCWICVGHKSSLQCGHCELNGASVL